MTLIAWDLSANRAVKLGLNGTVQLKPCSDPPTKGLYLSPGWTDLQVNGFAGYDMNSANLRAEDVAKMVRRLWKEGVSNVYPTVVTNSAEHIERCLHVIAQAHKTFDDVRASVRGIHLEGPYISPLEGARGAHHQKHIRPPKWNEFARWQDAADGHIRLVTLAPELPGAIAFIRKLVTSGVVVAIGHTLATHDELARAVDAGAVLSTHLGNGILAMLPRHPNVIWDQLAEENLYASIIADGHHLQSQVMRVMIRAKGVDKTILISDAVTLASMPPGVYDRMIGGKVELHPDGQLTVWGTNYLAGSTCSLKRGVENAVLLAGCSLAEATTMASINPGKLMRDVRDDAKTVFDWHNGRIRILATLVAGKVVYQATDSASGSEDHD